MFKPVLIALFFSASCGSVCAGDNTDRLRTDAASKRRLPPITSQCIFIRSLSDWRALDRYNLIVWAPSRKHPYHLELDSACHDLRHVEAISFTAGADGRLCGFGGDAVIVSSGGWTDRCSIGAIHKLTMESAEELIAAFKQLRENRVEAARRLRAGKERKKQVSE